MRFSEIAQAIPQLSDRLLSERMKELEARGIVERRVQPDAPVKVEYELTDMGRELAPTLAAAEVLVAPLADLTRRALVRAVQCRARCALH